MIASKTPDCPPQFGRFAAATVWSPSMPLAPGQEVTASISVVTSAPLDLLDIRVAATAPRPHIAGKASGSMRTVAACAFWSG